MEREAFLARVRAALDTSESPPGLLPVVRSGDERQQAAPAEAPVDRLIHELEAVGGQVRRVDSAAAARAAIVEILAERGVDRVVCGDTERLRSLELEAELSPAGIESTVCRLDSEATADDLRAAAFAAGAGITSVDAGVAETGTLVLRARPGQGRAISLLPPIHIAVLAAADVVRDLSALMAEVAADGEELPSALTFITGPSRTGDIELVLTVGVHGPGELHLIVVG